MFKPSCYVGSPIEMLELVSSRLGRLGHDSGSPNGPWVAPAATFENLHFFLFLERGVTNPSTKSTFAPLL